MNDLPQITIITVNYNHRPELERTIRSVVGQDYPHLQYIVIDGGSTDGSAGVLETYRQHLDFSLSESDEGIYDAMNKGVTYARGKWTLFLNSGDVLPHSRVISECFSNKDYPENTFIYGNHIADYGDFKRHCNSLAIEKIHYGMIFSHQALFAPTALLQKQPFDVQYKYSADYDFIYRHFLSGYPFRKADLTIAELKAGGASEKNIIKTHRERHHIMKKYNYSPGKDIVYGITLLKLFLIRFVKSILPESIIRRILHNKYKNSITNR